MTTYTYKSANESLYKKMIETERMAYHSQDELLKAIKQWLLKVIDEDSADHTRVILAEGGYVKIRTVEELSENILTNFKNEFNFDICWIRIEDMTDFRSVASVKAKIFEYAFLPKDINKILGDNQVDFGDSDGTY